MCVGVFGWLRICDTCFDMHGCMYVDTLCICSDQYFTVIANILLYTEFLGVL